MMRDELSHKRTLELALAHLSSTTNPVPMVGHFDVGKYFQVKHVHAIVFVQSQPQAVDDSSRAASGSASATVTTTISSYDDEIAALVFDGSSMFFKAGFAGDPDPCAVFPSVVTGSPIPNTTFIRSAQNRFVGDEAIANLNCFYLEHPIQRGLITDWDQMEKVIYYNNSNNSYMQLIVESMMPDLKMYTIAIITIIIINYLLHLIPVSNQTTLNRMFKIEAI